MIVQALKTWVIDILKLIGAFLLLAILVKGIAGLFLYVEPAKHWLTENEDGDFVDTRLSVAWFGGLALWFYLIHKIKRAGMSDEDKIDSDRQAGHGGDDAP